MVDFDALNVAINGAFGESLLYQRSTGGAPIPFQGVFTDAYKIKFEDGSGKVGWSTTAPSVGLRIADLAFVVAKDDVITRLKNGSTFLVFNKAEDGLGWLNVTLKANS